MGAEYREHLAGIGFLRRKGTTNTTVVEHERGGTAGYQIERWDDSMAAIVTPKRLDVTSVVREVG